MIIFMRFYFGGRSLARFVTHLLGIEGGVPLHDRAWVREASNQDDRSQISV